MSFVFTIKNAAVKVKDLDLFLAGVKRGCQKVNLTISQNTDTKSEAYSIAHETLFIRHLQLFKSDNDWQIKILAYSGKVEWEIAIGIMLSLKQLLPYKIFAEDRDEEITESDLQHYAANFKQVLTYDLDVTLSMLQNEVSTEVLVPCIKHRIHFGQYWLQACKHLTKDEIVNEYLQEMYNLINAEDLGYAVANSITLKKDNIENTISLMIIANSPNTYYVFNEVSYLCISPFKDAPIEELILIGVANCFKVFDTSHLIFDNVMLFKNNLTESDWQNILQKAKQFHIPLFN